MTIKSSADLTTELTTYFPDNTDYDITAAEFRTLIQDILDSLHGIYGGLYVAAGATPQSLTTTPAQLTGWAGTLSAHGTTPSASSDNITVGTAGIYKVDGHFTCTGVAAITYKLTLCKNGSAVTGIETQAKPAGTDLFTFSFTSLVSCAASDVLTVYGESDDAGGQNLTMVDCQLVVLGVA